MDGPGGFAFQAIPGDVDASGPGSTLGHCLHNPWLLWVKQSALQADKGEHLYKQPLHSLLLTLSCLQCTEGKEKAKGILLTPTLLQSRTRLWFTIKQIRGIRAAETPLYVVCRGWAEWVWEEVIRHHYLGMSWGSAWLGQGTGVHRS